MEPPSYRLTSTPLDELNVSDPADRFDTSSSTSRWISTSSAFGVSISLLSAFATKVEADWILSAWRLCVLDMQLNPSDSWGLRFGTLFQGYIKLSNNINQFKKSHIQLVLKQPIGVHGLQPVSFECNLYCSMLVCISIHYYCNTNI